MDASIDRVKYDCLLFDLDDTLYPLSTGINLACRKNIIDYMVKCLNMEEGETPRLCLELYREYGTTMAGLMANGHDFDCDEFHEYVHGRLPYDRIKPDPVLRNLLLSIPQRKIVFTNSDKAHAARVLSRLGLEDCFEGVICFETLNPSTESDRINMEEDDNTVDASKPQILCKPSLEAIEAAIRMADINPRRTIFFDDSARNIASAKAAGLHTVIVGSSELVPGADHALSCIHNIKEALPEIWEGEGEGERAEQLEQVLQSPAVETIALA
ncbi:hypothetical protein Nepgr_030809 [Nepenthes gracilis]|uniref:Uncharacterized protein n=1 Tax=Nepenthes gracilis TaxID=150966 RepID=A0AAD3Y6Y1_NEPGR|nr:hypothetical protein Nepgr_030809 [Nepenthes gracilis]